MTSDRPPGSRKRDILLFLGAAALPMPWLVAERYDGMGLEPQAIAVLAGVAILGAAFLLSWATELAERDIPQGLAILVLALVSVLPEYAIDLHFAWTAGHDPTYAQYAVANMTGANRLLIGFGWAVVVLIACWRSRTSELQLSPRQGLEVRFLIWATLYSFFIPLSGTINLFDAIVLFTIFGFYAYSAARSGSEEIQLVGPAAMIDRRSDDRGRRFWVAVIFLFAGYGIFIAAEPFANALVEIGRHSAVDEFLLVQWVAPLASESPEFLIAILFALRMRGSVGIGALISSKVNQWTLLVGAIPIAFSLSSGGSAGLPLDERQTEELFLTSAQSLLAVVLIADLRFSRVEALLLAALFGAQFAYPGTDERYVFIAAYLGVALALVVMGGAQRRAQLFALAVGVLPGKGAA